MYKESLLLGREVGINQSFPNDLEGLAANSSVQSDASRAARLWGSAEALREATSNSPDRAWHAALEPRLAAARGSTEEAAWVEAWTEGRTITLEEAVAYALE